MDLLAKILPVVFHIIHLGEPLGFGSNISDGAVLAALQNLNDNFRDVGGTGYDAEIEFCLAQRDPDGLASTGINRINGSGVGNYQNIGMAQGFNEAQIKALSIWPNTDYINIWVVVDIAGSFNAIRGFATFPGTPAPLDGIVIEANATGTPAGTGVLTHEMGHYFDLFHTFEGGSAVDCPPNNDCHVDGDRVCDTPPHKLVIGGCDTFGQNTCDGNSSNALVAHNHMNFTDNSCRNEFTPNQVMRLRCAMMQLRGSLMYSLGCQPGCSSTIADFNMPSSEVEENTTVTFTNNSSFNATSFIWRIDGEEEGGSQNLTYTFNDPGFFEICLDAIGPDCINRKCLNISVYADCDLFTQPDPCELVLNGDFEQINAGLGSDEISTPSQVCGWMDVSSTPFYCSLPNSNTIAIRFAGRPQFSDIERVVSELPLELEPNSDCTISFDYLVTNYSPASILIGLTDAIVDGNNGMPPNTNIIAAISSPSVDVNDQENHECYPENASFHHYSGAFTYPGDGKLFLNISGETGFEPHPLGPNFLIYRSSIIYIDNISINCCGSGCTPSPNFTSTTNGCTVSFTGSNDGDEGEYTWNFGDGSAEATGENVSHTYLFDGTFPVCLTVNCLDNPEISSTICQDVTVENECDHCERIEKVTAAICDKEADGSLEFLSNFSFNVPKGTVPCIEEEFYAYSDQVGLTVESYSIDDSDPAHDVISVALTVIPPQGYDFATNGATGFINLCDESGKSLCFSFDLVSETCDQCEEPLSSDASCNDPDASDGVFVYEGSISFSLEDYPDAYQCEALSTEAGFNATYLQSGNDWTIEYSTSTTEEDFTGADVLLCFIYEQEIKICIPLTINVKEPCGDLPIDCVDEWSPKHMACKSPDEGNGLVTFHIPNMTIFGSADYSFCDGGLFGSVDGGGTVEVNYAEINGLQLTFDINIVIPSSEFVSGQTYNVSLYLCDKLGNTVCYLLPYRLTCEGHGGGGDRNHLLGFDTSNASNGYEIFPNPATDKLMIVTGNFDAQVKRDVRMTNHQGRLVKQTGLFSDREAIDVSAFQSGIYFVTILESGVPMKVEKVVIMR